MAKLYPIIGGPLDGQKANYKDFADATYSYVYQAPDGSLHSQWVAGAFPVKDKIIKPAGLFHNEADSYVAFNRADRYAQVPSMLWLWVETIT